MDRVREMSQSSTSGDEISDLKRELYKTRQENERLLTAIEHSSPGFKTENEGSSVNQSLMIENQRLRAALDPRGAEMDALLRSLEQDSSALQEEVLSARRKINRLERELQGVYVRWNADHGKWSTERERLSSQIRMLTDMMSSHMPESESIKGWQELLHQSQELIVALEGDKKTILSEWENEFARLAELVREQSEWWDAERSALCNECDHMADFVLRKFHNEAGASEATADVAQLLSRLRDLRSRIYSTKMMDPESLQMLSTDRPRTSTLSMVHNDITYREDSCNV
eukprot:gb/GECG01011237.1/.p1 GENE.gb/GECG01011237.1/~~gb/GECG01011237.1/.p1  ORF type:complete len:286 (+),score=34.88 gb/GECG01011237.1/:1-858(+)